MTDTFKAVENKNWYRRDSIGKEQSRYQVIQFDKDGDEVGVTGASSSNIQEARQMAREMQDDEKAGITIEGMPADDWHAKEAGMAGEVLEYYRNLPELSAKFGVEQADALHPWRVRMANANA